MISAKSARRPRGRHIPLPHGSLRCALLRSKNIPPTVLRLTFADTTKIGGRPRQGRGNGVFARASFGALRRRTPKQAQADASEAGRRARLSASKYPLPCRCGGIVRMSPPDGGGRLQVVFYTDSPARNSQVSIRVSGFNDMLSIPCSRSQRARSG